MCTYKHGAVVCIVFENIMPTSWVDYVLRDVPLDAVVSLEFIGTEGDSPLVLTDV